MFEWNRDVTARSLNAIYRWTSPVELPSAAFAICFLLIGLVRSLWGGGDLVEGRLGVGIERGNW